MKFQNTLYNCSEMTKPVRNVKSNGRTNVGHYPSKKNGRLIQFESGLEKNLIKLLEFDPNVLEFFDQPFRIRYKDKTGKDRTYVPDFFAKFRNGTSIIFEVKIQDFIDKNVEMVNEISKAGRSHGNSIGARFEIVTEKVLKTHLIDNVSLLLDYQNKSVDMPIQTRLIEAFIKTEKPTLNKILEKASFDIDRAELIRPLWTMVANGLFTCNLSEALNLNSAILNYQATGFEFTFQYSACQI
jgi:hypothetical protein